MRKVLLGAGVAALLVGLMPSPAGASSVAAPSTYISVNPNALPAGYDFTVSGGCADQSVRGAIQLVRQARPGAAARIIESHTPPPGPNNTYQATFHNALVGTPAFPVDAEVVMHCGAASARAPFVSTQLTYPNALVPIATITGDGPCGTCVPHLKGFDQSANLSTIVHGFVERMGDDPSLAFTTAFSGNSRIMFGSGRGVQAQATEAPGISQSIYPYGAFTGGVNVAMADLNGDGLDELVTGPGAGGGPHVKVFSPKASGASQQLPGAYAEIASFFAYDPSFIGGVRVALADVTGDATPEIITAPGPGGGPHVKIFTAAGQFIGGFYAYAPNFANGVWIAAGDVTGDGKAEIVTGAGPGGAPHVRTFDGQGTPIGNGFYAYDEHFTGGVSVAVGNIDRPGAKEIVTGAGPGGMPHVRWFTSPDGAWTNPGFYAYEGLPTGVRVAAQ